MSALRPSPPARKPWSMGVVAIAIVAGLALYTYLRLHYAKPGKAHEPYAENRARTNLERIAAAGWSHAPAEFERIVDLPSPRGNIRLSPQPPAAVGELQRVSTENWHLPVAYEKIAAPAALRSDLSYTVSFEAKLDQARAQIEGFDIFWKKTDVVVVPRWEPIPAGLEPRNQPVTGRMLWAAGALPPGRYRVTLLAIRECAEWDLDVATH